MNASAIIPGLEYAFTHYPSKNRAYYHDVHRVRVLHVYKLETERSYKRQTWVECQLLTDDGELQLDYRTQEPRPVITIKARQIVYTWEEHLIEKERYETTLNEEREQRRKVEEERHRAQQAERQKLEDRIKAIQEFVLENLDLPDSAGVIYVTSSQVIINRFQIEEVLRRNGNGRNPESDADQKHFDVGQEKNYSS